MKKDKFRVRRGGGWSSDARSTGVAYLSWNVPSGRDDFLGFRLSRLIIPLQQLSEVLDER